MSSLLFLIGLITVIAAFGTDTAPAGTHNLGLLQQQMMTLHCGLAMLIISAILYLRPVAAKPIIERSTNDDEGFLDPNIERDNKRWIFGIIAVIAGVILIAILYSRT